VKEYKLVMIAGDLQEREAILNKAAEDGFVVQDIAQGFGFGQASYVKPVALMVRDKPPTDRPAPRPNVFKGPAEQYMDKP
jgi:hypothetical protein